MILIVALLVSIVIGLARGGRLGNLNQLPMRYEWLPLSLFLVQVSLVIFPVIESQVLWNVQALAIVFSYGGLLVFLYLNRFLPGAKLILLGTALNFAVILANGGYMPVAQEALRAAGHEDLIITRNERQYVLGSKDVVLERSQTRLAPLSDILVIPEETPLSGSFSIGDVVIAIGAFFLLNEALLGKCIARGDTIFSRSKTQLSSASTDAKHHSTQPTHSSNTTRPLTEPRVPRFINWVAVRSPGQGVSDPEIDTCWAFNTYILRYFYRRGYLDKPRDSFDLYILKRGLILLLRSRRCCNSGTRVKATEFICSKIN